jgi:superfamily I DNA/RNA helicase
MPAFQNTPEQDAIVQMAVESTENFAVIARAGAAKTSTLILIAEALPSTDILCLAFNKAIAQEMTERLPSNCESKTLHSLGYKAWWGFIRKKMTLQQNKMYQILKKINGRLQDKEEQDEMFELFSETLQIISEAKNAGYLPQKYKGHGRSLVDSAEFYDGLAMEPTRLQVAAIDEALNRSFELAFEGELDFDDMIYCPAICSVSWPAPSLTLIDEAQDLSPINHHVLKKLVKNRRIIAVGDPCQAIYGFRGALADSMKQMISRFSMHTLYLTISFRCSRKVTQNAHWLAPDMRSPEWAVEGEVSRPITWETSMLQDGDAILCRNNAPLFRMAFILLEQDRLPEVAGRDIAKPLIKVMDKLGAPEMPAHGALEQLARWEKKQLDRAREGARGGIHDKAECIRILLSKGDTLGGAIQYLNHLMQRDGRIYLMTIHKSKGLEFDRVFFLDSFLCRIERDQDANLKYVAETRAKNSLTYIMTEGLGGSEAAA